MHLSSMPGYMVISSDSTELGYRHTFVYITLHDGVKGGLVDATRLHAQEGRLGEHLQT